MEASHRRYGDWVCQGSFSGLSVGGAVICCSHSPRAWSTWMAEVVELRWLRIIRKIKGYLNMTAQGREVLEAEAMLDDSESVQQLKRTREVGFAA